MISIKQISFHPLVGDEALPWCKDTQCQTPSWSLGCIFASEEHEGPSIPCSQQAPSLASSWLLPVIAYSPACPKCQLLNFPSQACSAAPLLPEGST